MDENENNEAVQTPEEAAAAAAGASPAATSGGEAPAEAALPDDVEALKQALEEARAKAESNFASWQRSAADFINYKRRAEQEKADTAKSARAMLILNLLPVVDDLERALESVSTKLAGLTWVEGIQIIYRKLVAILEAQGLTEIKALGEGFDPNLHEAVLQGPGPEGKVVEVVQKGYRLQDRLVRPAMVRVGTGEAPAGDPAPQSEKEDKSEAEA
jgi:molecular chaperone GrpE